MLYNLIFNNVSEEVNNDIQGYFNFYSKEQKQLFYNCLESILPGNGNGVPNLPHWVYGIAARDIATTIASCNMDVCSHSVSEVFKNTGIDLNPVQKYVPWFNAFDSLFEDESEEESDSISISSEEKLQLDIESFKQIVDKNNKIENGEFPLPTCITDRKPVKYTTGVHPSEDCKMESDDLDF